MKTLIKTLIILTLPLFLTIGFGCKKNEIDIADESIVVSSYPSISIYKTKRNYFDNIMVGINANNEVISYPDYNEKSDGVVTDRNEEYKFKYKWFLASGYVVVKDIDFINSAVTDISLTEFINFNEPYKTNWTSEMLTKRMIDNDPFTSLYHLNGLNKTEKTFTLGELNDMIENGTIEDYFEKLK